MEVTSLDSKARAVFGERVTNKAVAQREEFVRIPRYVVEYLVATHCTEQDPSGGLEEVKRIITDRYPAVRDAERIRHRLRQDGRYSLLDEVSVRVDMEQNIHFARIPTLDENNARISEYLVEKHQRLLQGGAWGRVDLEYDPTFLLNGRTYPLRITDFIPFQVGTPDVDDYCLRRAQFTTDEWIDLILASVGYDGAKFARRVKFLLPSRLVMLAENNVNLIELGPRQTGKTYLLRNTSPYSFIVSGAKATPASLFVNLQRQTVGIIGNRDVVAFDEIAATFFHDADTTISTFKDYMESGQFSRGNKTYRSACSILLGGNIDVQHDQPHEKYPHLFRVLPKPLKDVAFLDRLHGYIPGWEIPKLTPERFSQGYGFVSDYFSEILSALRHRPFQSYVEDKQRPLKNVTQRDRISVRRITAGLLKLIYPHSQFTAEEFLECLHLAIEYRQRVHNQLCVMRPGEFQEKIIGYEGIPQCPAPDLDPARRIAEADDRANTESIVGEITGLTAILSEDGEPIGGDILLIEVSSIAGAKGLRITGKHGPVLDHSVQSAYDHLVENIEEYGLPRKAISDRRISVHLTKISEEREGPSAGLAFVLGMISAISERPIRPKIAVTGEVTLHGRVIAVGATAQKLTAAHRRGRRIIIIPKENEPDLAYLPQVVKDELEVHLVDSVKDSVGLVLES